MSIREDDEDKTTWGQTSFIDSLFFESMPKTAKRVTDCELTQATVNFDMKESSYIDQSYFQDPTTCEDSIPESRESVADCIAGVREQLGVNQYSGGKLDFNSRRQHHPKIVYDSQGFRLPDDDPIKFSLLTEYEAAEVLHECIISVQKNLIVINKPPGIACQGGQGQRFSVDILLPRLAHKFKSSSYDECENFQLPHRVDKGATGILLISRDRSTHLKLTEAFANRWITKSYLCITSGIPLKKEGNIYFPISQKKVGGIYRMVTHRPRTELSAGREVLSDVTEDVEALEKLYNKTNAVTRFKVLDKRNDTALMECCTVTGLKHQIRTHLSAALETPILGDHKYSHFGHLAPQRLSKRTLEALAIRQSKVRYMGLHLHAHSIKFSGVPDTIVTPFLASSSQPPEGFFAFLDREYMRGVRQFSAPVPSFFLTTLNRLGMHIPSWLRWTRFKLF